MNDPGSGARLRPRARMKGRSRLGSACRCSAEKWAAFVFELVHRAACLRNALTATIEHSNEHAMVSACGLRRGHTRMLRAGIGRCHSRGMGGRTRQRMSEVELHALFDGLFPSGFAGPDVLDQIAPEGWERSPLLACFHPSIERIFEERLLMHRNLEELRRMRRRRDGSLADESSPVPTLEDVRKEYEPSPVQQDDEVTELVGLCLWDIFSDNHEVIGRTAAGPTSGLFVELARSSTST